MKKRLLIPVLCLMSVCSLYASNAAGNDTTILFNNKVIQINDSTDQVRVKVKQSINNDTTEFKTVFEGLYSDKQSYERWSVVEELGIQIPFVTRKKETQRRRYNMRPHWAGFGWGRIAMTDGIDLNNVSGVKLDLNRSYEFNFNMIEHITPILFRTIGISSGMGFSWRHYALDNNTYLEENNNYISVVNGAPGERYRYSRLNNWYLTIPIMLELQMFKSSRLKPYLAAGVIGDVQLSTSYKTKYINATGSTKRTKQVGMNVLPVSMDYIAQAGMGNISLYAKYSPISIFESKTGPSVQHASIGFLIGF